MTLVWLPTLDNKSPIENRDRIGTNQQISLLYFFYIFVILIFVMRRQSTGHQPSFAAEHLFHENLVGVEVWVRGQVGNEEEPMENESGTGENR